ncbi:unnamed protein product [Prorocentrum cordatum]|uniref:Uncharacterized protein n=1 Tax=Prorocentrum cordatum TaxID=2364126 RepID=A0ABN9V867_9DINO|nr:unnamed protein product [Polarella glacialis]
MSRYRDIESPPSPALRYQDIEISRYRVHALPCPPISRYLDLERSSAGEKQFVIADEKNVIEQEGSEGKLDVCGEVLADLGVQPALEEVLHGAAEDSGQDDRERGDGHERAGSSSDGVTTADGDIPDFFGGLEKLVEMFVLDDMVLQD